MIVKPNLSTEVRPKPITNKLRQAIHKEELENNPKLPIVIKTIASKKLALLFLLSAKYMITKQPNALPTNSIAFMSPNKWACSQ